ncbi:MAG TPA: ABC transporter ATP-binding protein [Vicinamibacterales bacterium]|nr:ABC transporter ATP-binding protein [Vicinamibacterales bacterium]
MIEVQHLTKRYGRVTAVEDVSFRVERGEILGFLGPNGAGKTTTMRILTGYMPATAGKAVVAGFDVFDQPLEAKRRTGYLPETPPLYPDMTVREYLTFVASIKGIAPGDRSRRVSEAMARTSVADMAARHCGKLSKGYRQRVGLAQAILHNPDVLILDEPTAGLDPKQIIETRQLIKDLAGTHTIILSTHILPEVSQTCQRVVIINHGRVVAVDTPDNLMHRLRGSETLYLQVDAGGVDVTATLAGVPGVTRVAAGEAPGTGAGTGYEVQSAQGEDVRRELARAVVTHGWGLLELRPMRMSLEEIFLHLTTEEEKEPAEATHA